MNELERALEQNVETIRSAMTGAEAELKELESQMLTLRSVIGRAKGILGDATDDRGDLTLHDALVIVLEGSEQEWLTVTDLAGEVNRRNLYRMKDGRPVEPGQIHARVNNYRDLFEKRGAEVRLRYRRRTTLIPRTSGAYWAASTVVVQAVDGETMYVETRVAYSVTPPPAVGVERYLLALAEERSRRLVADGMFQPGGSHIEMLSNAGWQAVDPEPGSA